MNVTIVGERKRSCACVVCRFVYLETRDCIFQAARVSSPEVLTSTNIFIKAALDIVLLDFECSGESRVHPFLRPSLEQSHSTSIVRTEVDKLSVSIWTLCTPTFTLLPSKIL